MFSKTKGRRRWVLYSAVVTLTLDSHKTGFLQKPRCLIHNAHVGKIVSFFIILDLKISRLEKNFHQYSGVISDIMIPAGHSKAKTYYITSQN
jgi:hypothetical protein